MKHLLFVILCVLLTAYSVGAEDVEPTTLKQSVVSAVKQHPNIKSLQHNRDAQSRNLAASLGRFFPSLDLTSDFGFQRYSSGTARSAGTEGRTRTASDTTLMLTQNVFDGFDRYSGYQGAKDRLTSAEFRLLDNVQTVALDAVRAHVDVDRGRKLLKLAEQNIVAHQEVLNSIIESVAGGAASKADEMQARGRVARAETTKITYLGNLRNSEAQYKRVVGYAPVALAEPEYTLQHKSTSMGDLIERTIDNNPKVMIFKSELKAIENDMDVTKSAMFPVVDVELSSRHADNLDGSADYLQDNRAMLAFSWNLFSGTSDYNDLLAAESRVEQAQADLEDTIDDLARQSASAWTDYETAVQSIDKHVEALEYSIQSRDMYLMQFNVGQRSLLDVLDSINEVFSNSVLLESAQANRVFSLYKFLALQGELVQALEVSEKAYDSERQK